MLWSLRLDGYPYSHFRSPNVPKRVMARRRPVELARAASRGGSLRRPGRGASLVRATFAEQAAISASPRVPGAPWA